MEFNENNYYNSEEIDWESIIGCLVIIGFVWAINEQNKANELSRLLQENNNNYQKLLKDYSKKHNSISEEIIQQLVELRDNYIAIDDKIGVELKTIIDLIEQNKEEIAIEKMTKVIEHLLKEKYIAEKKAQDKKSCPNLFNMLEEALTFGWINKHEYNFSDFLRENRNLEAHELAVKLPKNWKYISFLSGIEIIYKLKGIKRND